MVVLINYRYLERFHFMSFAVLSVIAVGYLFVSHKSTPVAYAHFVYILFNCVQNKCCYFALILLRFLLLNFDGYVCLIARCVAVGNVVMQPVAVRNEVI